MYNRAYGIIETMAPLHVGASAGEESGNINLIFRDQFIQTGIIPGSSIRGRFRADMRSSKSAQNAADYYGKDSNAEDGTTEGVVKFEYASLVWLPVFCPGQPIVWVTCPWLLKRYKQIRTDIAADIPDAYSASNSLRARDIGNNRKILFFNLGFLEIDHTVDLSPWLPAGVNIPPSQLVVVDDNDMAMIHDMALYRQSRVALEEGQKKAKQGAFFNVEALPEGSVLIFPIALKETGWQPFGDSPSAELYFGGLESIGFGRCQVTIGGEAMPSANSAIASTANDTKQEAA